MGPKNSSKEEEKTLTEVVVFSGRCGLSEKVSIDAIDIECVLCSLPGYIHTHTYILCINVCIHITYIFVYLCTYIYTCDGRFIRIPLNISENSQITPGTLKIPSFLLFLNEIVLFPSISRNSIYPNYLIGMMKEFRPSEQSITSWNIITSSYYA